jgi:hypothetical protein
MNSKKAREIKEIALKFYNKDIQNKGITFKNFYRRFKD